MWFAAFFATLALLLGGGLYVQNQDDPELSGEITVITSTPLIEEYLEKYKEALNKDYEGYKGHLYRILTYTNHLLHGEKKYREAIEAALVFHDIGLWSDSKLDYLDPSWERARKVLSSKFSEEELQLVHDIIIYHHKFTSFEGKNAKYVNAVRKADWIDASMGIIKKGMSRENIAKVEKAIPNAGFHKTLLNFGPRIHGWNYFKSLNEIRKIFYL